MGKPEFEAVYNALGKNYNNFPRGNSLIVDVTKSGNGCGGCKTAAMKAGVPEQAMWRTTDGQAWFLRDTAFSEPSGDYTSNCYLGITRVTPTDVQFNDQDCKHGSDDYLCQKEQIAAVLTQGQGRCTCPNGTPKNICMVANAAACASCNPGFKINSNMDQCVDINECATNRGGCDSKHHAKTMLEVSPAPTVRLGGRTTGPRAAKISTSALLTLTAATSSAHASTAKEVSPAPTVRVGGRTTGTKTAKISTSVRRTMAAATPSVHAPTRTEVASAAPAILGGRTSTRLTLTRTARR